MNLDEDEATMSQAEQTMAAPQITNRFRRLCIHLFCVGLAFSAHSCKRKDSSAPPGGKKPLLKPCLLSSPHALLESTEAECGNLEVPENWGKPSGVKIKVHVAVVRSKAGQAKPDPLFFFAGGPGEAASESFLGTRQGFTGIRRHRDIVLIDQRGTGKSNPLQCKGMTEGLEHKELSLEEEETMVRKCIRSLNADLSQYTTAAYLKDVNHARIALGYQKINLLGMSYGTRVALSYLRQYPKQVRAVILDGTLPLSMVLGPDAATNGPKRTKEHAIRRCNADPSCKKQFPNLSKEFSAVEGLIRRGPMVEAKHPRTRKAIRKKFGWSAWSQTLRNIGYTGETAALLPLLIHSAHETKDFGRLLTLSTTLAEGLEHLSMGTYMSVVCSEDHPFFSKKHMIRRSDYGYDEIERLTRLCNIWPHQPVNADFKQPVVSDTPILLLSGELDPVTPPSHAEVAAKTLSQSIHIVVPEHGHIMLNRGCVGHLAAKFIENPGDRDIDTSCVRRAHRIPIFIDQAGPAH